MVAALAWDFCYYWFHRFSHEISILWAAHAVHHQSEDYNLSTALRQTSTGFLFGWIFYLPLFLIGFPLEILVAVNAINLIYQFWVHTQLVGRLGVFDRIFVTPSNHRVHHAQNARYIDKNYGGMLILWDRLFGTFEDEAEDEPVVFGVRKPLANLNPFLGQPAGLRLPAVRRPQSAPLARQACACGFVVPAGARPMSRRAIRNVPRTSRRFKKFDPDVADGQRHYVLAQFAVSVAWGLLVAELYVRQGHRRGIASVHAVVVAAIYAGFAQRGSAIGAARRMAAPVIAVAVAVLVHSGRHRRGRTAGPGRGAGGALHTGVGRLAGTSAVAI